MSEDIRVHGERPEWRPEPPPLPSGCSPSVQAHGTLLVFDEIQADFGRTVDWFAAQAYGVTPDMMTMPKAIGASFSL